MNEVGIDTLGPYILSLIVLVTASAFFSGTEVALFSLRRVDREQLQRSDRTTDSLIVRLLAKPARLIATLLIGNEVVNVLLKAVGQSIVFLFIRHYRGWLKVWVEITCQRRFPVAFTPDLRVDGRRGGLVGRRGVATANRGLRPPTRELVAGLSLRVRLSRAGR